MVDRIEELLAQVAEEEDRQEDGPLPTGEGAAPAPWGRRPDGPADGLPPRRDGTGAPGGAPEGPSPLPGDGRDTGLALSWPELAQPAALPPPGPGPAEVGELPNPQAVPQTGAGAGLGTPGAAEAASGLETLYRAAREAVAPAALPAPAGGREGLALRRAEPGTAASLAVDELDRAVRRDSRRYDGEMLIY